MHAYSGRGRGWRRQKGSIQDLLVWGKSGARRLFGLYVRTGSPARAPQGVDMNEISFSRGYVRLTLQPLLPRGEKRPRGWCREERCMVHGRSGSRNLGGESARGYSAGAEIVRPADTRRHTALITCHHYAFVQLFFSIATQRNARCSVVCPGGGANVEECTYATTAATLQYSWVNPTSRS
ncbi:hypothetical protein O3P69_011854 [Scylla paramamosain]|uniref:Uncharacterized protein n=1 Tax=Scylla paramamosain TaxID=85552 RepID=A0AAW0SAI5_SCYPA